MLKSVVSRFAKMPVYKENWIYNLKYNYKKFENHVYETIYYNFIIHFTYQY